MADRGLRIALLSYRGAPHCGGQGVYVRNLSRELAAQGHHVEVLGGPPYPELDEGVELTRLASLDLYHESDPFRTPRPGEFRDGIDVLEYAAMCTAAFPEPLTFSLRAKREIASRRAEFDLVHDNQCLGWGLLGMQRLGLPVLATVHHPITVDRELELAATTSPWRRLTLRRWYAFTRMQARVARRLPRLVTVSEQSAGDVAAAFDVPRERLEVIHNGVDERRFRPREEVHRVPGRLVTTASADAPLKGLVPLLEALAKIRTRRDDVHLVVVGRRKKGGLADRAMQELSLPDDAVRFVHGIDDEQLATLLASAEVAVVPSLYEGFSLPAIESMACGTPLVATTGGALPEVAGTDGDTALLVPPGEPGPLATAIERLLDDPQLRARLGDAGRLRVLERFTWRVAAARTAEQYRHVIASREEPAPVTAASRTPPC
jgi:glycosyltransferase involved in cell wall biosynthesis